MVARTRTLRPVERLATRGPLPVNGSRFESAPVRWETPPALTPADRQRDEEAAQERLDRFGGVIAVGLVAAFVAFVVWVFSHGIPANYDPTWDYWMY